MLVDCAATVKRGRWPKYLLVKGNTYSGFYKDNRARIQINDL